MLKNKKTMIALLAGLGLLAVAGLALVPLVSASAAGLSDGLFQRSAGGPLGARSGDDTYLAEALGITVEELQSARTATWEAAVDQALDQGLITEAQAERLKAGAGGFHGRGLGMLGFLAGDETAFNFDALLAEQLGISADELSAARDEAFELRLQDALDSGELTEEQAELMRAHHALKDTIDHQSLLATALGISVEDLEAARQEGKTIADLMTELGLTADEVQENLQAAYEAAVQQAVEDGVITSDQATLLLENAGPDGHFGPPGFGPHGMHGGGGH
jgi:ribosomal protein S20